jgi:hypothetical protein
MKKTLTVLIAAAMMFTAVSCGKKADSSSSETAEATTNSIADLLQSTTTAEELEQELAEMKEKAMERIDLTAKPIPEYTIPDDWQEMSDGRMSFLVPPDVEDKSSSTGSLILGKFMNEDKSVSVITMDGNDWSEHEEDEEDNYFPKVSEENCVRAFKELGLDYDGTRTSFYKAVLSFTSADRTDENAEAFDIAALAKGLCFYAFPEVYYKDSNGHDIYAHAYFAENMLGKTTNADNSKYWVGAFADSNREYTLIVNARSQEEALKICSTLTFVEEQG